MTRYLIVVMTFVLSAVTAFDAAAQQPATPPASGTMTVERIEEGFAWAPDVRVTEVNDRTATLIGGYAGWMTDRTWLIGGGGYWLGTTPLPPASWPGGTHPLDQLALESAQMTSMLRLFQGCEQQWSGPVRGVQ